MNTFINAQAEAQREGRKGQQPLRAEPGLNPGTPGMGFGVPRIFSVPLRTLSRHTVIPFIVGKTMKTVVFPAAVLPQGSGLESLNSRALESLAVRDHTVEMEPGHFIFPKVIPPQPAPFPRPKPSLE